MGFELYVLLDGFVRGHVLLDRSARVQCTHFYIKPCAMHAFLRTVVKKKMDCIV